MPSARPATIAIPLYGVHPFPEKGPFAAGL